MHSFFEEANVRFIPLNVSGAFHSPYMSDARKQFEEFIDVFTFSEPSIPVISNVEARPYKKGEIKKNLIEQITHSVKWTESVRYLMGRGEMEFEEIGPGKIFTRFIQNIQKDAAPLVVADVKRKQA